MKFMDFYDNKFTNHQDFKLTAKMLEENDYENCNVFYSSDYDGISGICIYQDMPDIIEIKVLEVRSDCRNNGIGTHLVNQVKNLNNKPIYVLSSVKAQTFYPKLGFHQPDPDMQDLEFKFDRN